MLSRRTLLIGALAGLGAGAGAYELVDRGVVPGAGALDWALGRCGETPPVPAATGPALEHGSFASRARGRTVAWTLARPPGAASARPLPVCLVLHGRGSDNASAFDDLHWDRHLAEAVQAGTPPFALVAADGGDGYWHSRADGDDAQAMLVDELLPMLHDRGFATDRFAVTGWSMGGYGALLLGERLGRDRVAAVVTASAAVWQAYGDAAAGAFDSADDFGRHDVLAGAGKLAGIPLRIDCGSSDPFVAGNRALRTAVGNPAGGIDAGCHDEAYWRRGATARMDFLGRGLAAAG